MDCREWDEESYRETILYEREALSQTVFRTSFAPNPNPNPNSDLIVTASSDGCIASYSISSCLEIGCGNARGQNWLVAEPYFLIQGHDGPAYDVKFYDDSLLLSCGDDGRIVGWKWEEIIGSKETEKGGKLKPVLDLLNPQHKGPWGTLSPIPENNAIAVDSQMAQDLARKYSTAIDPKSRYDFTCNFCGKVMKGGVRRVKKHLIGGFRNVKKCLACPTHVRDEIMEFMQKKEDAKKDQVLMSSSNSARMTDLDSLYFGEGEEEEEELNKGTSGKSFKIKKPRTRGPMDVFFSPNRANVGSSSKLSKGKQQKINEICKKDFREKVCSAFAKWFYDAGIPFNAANYDSFKNVVELVGQFGPGMKPPSYHDLRELLLKKEVAEVMTDLESHRKDWAIYGCSIIFDGWRDSASHRDIVNFLVNSPKGSIFIRSKDVSDIVKDANAILVMLEEMVDFVGEKNVIQIVTDNASNYKKAGQMVMIKKPHLYWSPCAAHCIDLMLEDIGKTTIVTNVMQKSMTLTSYIYNRIGLLNMMRRFTDKRELLRPAVTRFATSFITLKSIHEQKSNLRKMFTSDEWTKSKWFKEEDGKQVIATVLSEIYWKHVTYALTVGSPIVKVLRMVDAERKPPMGYIYEAMDRCKEAISKAFNGAEEIYKRVFEILDTRWNDQLHRPLHAAGHYLNPKFFYSDVHGSNVCEEVMNGLLDCIGRLNPDQSIQDKILNHELPLYRDAASVFGRPLAIRHRTLMAPAEWWKTFGAAIPNLQRFAIRLLSLTCSATGCERNWSVFQHCGSIYAAAGDSSAYCWDVEKCKVKMVFKGHSNYLHCVVSCKLSSQIVTGSEDGTARIWDCKSGKCIQVIDPEKDKKSKAIFPCVSCIALDSSESWLVCGKGQSLSLWNLPARECVSTVRKNAAVQDVVFDENQILTVGAESVLTRSNMNGDILSQIQCVPQSAFSISLHPSGVTSVAGYGGLVDIVSQFGSHLCTFRCRGL